jgi:hypothetical protein
MKQLSNDEQCFIKCLIEYAIRNDQPTGASPGLWQGDWVISNRPNVNVNHVRGDRFIDGCSGARSLNLAKLRKLGLVELGSGCCACPWILTHRGLITAAEIMLNADGSFFFNESCNYWGETPDQDRYIDWLYREINTRSLIKIFEPIKDHPLVEAFYRFSIARLVAAELNRAGA